MTSLENKISKKKRVLLATLVLILFLTLHAIYKAQHTLFSRSARTPTTPTTTSLEKTFNFPAFSHKRDIYLAKQNKKTKHEMTAVKPFNISLYTPVCPEMATKFHGPPHEQALNDRFVEYVRTWPGGSVKTLPHGLALIHPFRAIDQARCSAWSEMSGEVMVKAGKYGYHTEGSEWVVPPAEPWTPDITVSGPHVFFHSWFPSFFAHLMDDHLPSIAWLREQVSEDTRFLLLDNPLSRRFLEWFDLNFYNRVEWINEEEIVQVIDGDLMVFDRSCYKMSHPTLSSSLHMWFNSRAPLLLSTAARGNSSSRLRKPRSSIVFYTRSGPGALRGGRVVQGEHEQELLRLIRISMAKHHRQEELVIFSGYNMDNSNSNSNSNSSSAPSLTPMTFQQQFELMHSASILIGPHGAGMANSLYMPGGDSCATRPKMLEFTCGHSPNCTVQINGPYRSSYFYQASAPWLDYYQVNYDAARSTRKTTYVDVEAFQLALDAILRS